MKNLRLGSISLVVGSSAATAGLFLLTSMQGTLTTERLFTLTAEQAEILGHVSIVYLDDGQGSTSKTVRFTGVNVQVVNGLGATNGYPQDPTEVSASLTAVNGLGNLIVGYNALHPTLGGDHTGSHSIVGGTLANYSSWGGIVTGRHNAITAPNTAAVGGAGNRATFLLASVLGGYNNEAAAYMSSVCGGGSNSANFEYSTILGGNANTTAGAAAVVCGGELNVASSSLSVVVGGEQNTASGYGATVGGGRNRQAPGLDDWVAGSLFEDN